MATKKEVGIGPLTHQLGELQAMIDMIPSATDVFITVARIDDDPEKCLQFRVNLRTEAGITDAKAMAKSNLQLQQKRIRLAIKQAGGPTAAKKPAKKAVKK